MPNVRQSKEFVDEWRRLWEPDLEALAFNGATCDPTRVDPKVLQWVKNNCAQKPHFIKIINETASHGWLPPCGARDQGRQQCKLLVPGPFVREHFQKLGRVTTLENGTTHEKWKVSFGVPRKVASWLQGWKRVATGNNLMPGDVMVFVLVGNSHFLFHVFDERGQPKLQLHDPLVKAEPSSTSQQHENDCLHSLRSVKKLEPFDLEIVKPELVIIDQKNEIGATNSTQEGPEAPRDDSPEKSTVGRLEIGAGIAGCLPDSELTVSDIGEETVMATGWCEATAQPSGERSDEGRVRLRNHGVERVKLKLQEKEEMGGSVMNLEPHAVPLDPMAFFIESRRRMVAKVERKRAREVAKSHAELLVGYRFVVVLTAAQAYRDFYVPLPERFVSATRLSTALTRLRLVDCSGRAWEMYCRMHSSGEVAFHRKCWGLFSVGHLLEEGDACLFQLKSKDSRTMSVRIFRVVQLPKFEGRKNFSVHDHYKMRPKDQSKSDM